MTFDTDIYEIRVNPSEMDRIKSALVSNNMERVVDLLVPDSMVEQGNLVLLSPERLMVRITFNDLLRNGEE